MSEEINNGTPGKASGAGWTDHERLVYLVALVEQTAVKLDFTNTPRPVGRTPIACERMIQRLKNTLKDDLESLRAGNALPGGSDGTPKTPKTPKTPTKRKPKASGDEEGSPKKRGKGKQNKSVEVEERRKDVVKDEIADEA